MSYLVESRAGVTFHHLRWQLAAMCRHPAHLVEADSVASSSTFHRPYGSLASICPPQRSHSGPRPLNAIFIDEPS